MELHLERETDQSLKPAGHQRGLLQRCQTRHFGQRARCHLLSSVCLIQTSGHQSPCLLQQKLALGWVTSPTTVTGRPFMISIQTLTTSLQTSQWHSYHSDEKLSVDLEKRYKKCTLTRPLKNNQGMHFERYYRDCESLKYTSLNTIQYHAGR